MTFQRNDNDVEALVFATNPADDVVSNGDFPPIFHERCISASFSTMDIPDDELLEILAREEAQALTSSQDIYSRLRSQEPASGCPLAVTRCKFRHSLPEETACGSSQQVGFSLVF